MLESKWVHVAKGMLVSVLQLTALLQNNIFAVLLKAYCYFVKFGSLAIRAVFFPELLKYEGQMWLTLCVFLIIIRRNVNGLYCRHFNVLEECKKCRARVECNCLCSRLAAISHCAPYPPRPHQLTLTSIHTSRLRWREAQFNLLFCLLAVYCCFVLCVALTCHFITR